jgi:hypothetical protein
VQIFSITATHEPSHENCKPTQPRMRLLNVKTNRLEEFFGVDTPPYAILSHTWGPNEVTFKDIERKGYKSGSKKIDGCRRQAVKDGFGYIWIDTCCIDKSSSTELSEAINSMWSWYSEAEVCYAYLSDVPRGDDLEKENSAFRRSHWFTRGWTLQELIAPNVVSFYDEAWEFIGEKYLIADLGTEASPAEADSFISILSQITTIPSEIFQDNQKVRIASVAQKMSWAASRKTTRTEDVAYSLLGIFGVNMTMLYGEGTRAFIRLQEEIIKSSDDESIFAWGFLQPSEESASLFASSPKDFVNCGKLLPVTPAGVKSSHYLLTNKGLHIEMSICDVPIGGGTLIGRLNCSTFEERDSKSIALPLIRSKKDENTFSAARECAPVLVSSSLFPESARAHVYLQSDPAAFLNSTWFFCGFKIEYQHLGIKINEIYPPAWRGILDSGLLWNKYEEMTIQQHSILFLCEIDHRPNFAVRIDYTFQVEKHWLKPQEVQFRAAFIEKGKALAELMIENRERNIDAVLEWREYLDFGDAHLLFSLYKQKWAAWTLNMNTEMHEY